MAIGACTPHCAACRGGAPLRAPRADQIHQSHETLAGNSTHAKPRKPRSSCCNCSTQQPCLFPLLLLPVTSSLSKTHNETFQFTSQSSQTARGRCTGSSPVRPHTAGCLHAPICMHQQHAHMLSSLTKLCAVPVALPHRHQPVIYLANSSQTSQCHQSSPVLCRLAVGVGHVRSDGLHQPTVAWQVDGGAEKWRLVQLTLPSGAVKRL